MSEKKIKAIKRVVAVFLALAFFVALNKISCGVEEQKKHNTNINMEVKAAKSVSTEPKNVVGRNYSPIFRGFRSMTDEDLQKAYCERICSR